MPRPCKCEKPNCFPCYRWKHDAGFRAMHGGEADGTRAAFCQHIGRRLEFQTWCPSGWASTHECASRREDVSEFLGGIMQAVPSYHCQECPGYNVGASQNSSGLESGLPDSAGEPNGG